VNNTLIPIQRVIGLLTVTKNGNKYILTFQDNLKV